MEYIIMCGGYYQNFKEPKALSVIQGERLVDRTIRLLKENGITNIYISANDPIFDSVNVPRLEHNNSYAYKDNKIHGYWIDAYYPTDKPCVYLHGDVYYSEQAIKTIVNYQAKVNTFIGNEIARNKEHKNWGEPFGWIVVDQKTFRQGIEDTKKLQDEGKLERGYAISWELYRVLNGLDPNKQYINDDTYISINDETIDIDAPHQIEELNKKLNDRG
ncbi:MAG: hypothetical protein J6Y29_03870 [Clostridiales bacterium]|nr:hypothetical protein [Clostridiales bacterium]